MRSFQNDLSHQAHRIHVDARFGGSQIDRAAYPFSRRERLRNGTDHQLIRGGHPLGHKSGITADKIHAHFLRRRIKRLRNPDKIFLCPAGCASDQSDGRHGNSFVYNWNPEFRGNFLAGLHQVPRRTGNFLIHPAVQLIQIRIDAVKKADSQRDGPNIQIFLLDHFVGFIYFKYVDHGILPFQSEFFRLFYSSYHAVHKAALPAFRSFEKSPLAISCSLDGRSFPQSGSDICSCKHGIFLNLTDE